MDRYRIISKKPCKANAFNRNAAKQASLIKQGLRAAKFSPHEVYMAVDIDTPSIEEVIKANPKMATTEAKLEVRRLNELAVKHLQQAAKELGIKIRIGNEDYLQHGQTFVHVDVCPEFYGPGKPFFNQPHPKQWEQVSRW